MKVQRIEISINGKRTKSLIDAGTELTVVNRLSFRFLITKQVL